MSRETSPSTRGQVLDEGDTSTAWQASTQKSPEFWAKQLQADFQDFNDICGDDQHAQTARPSTSRSTAGLSSSTLKSTRMIPESAQGTRKRSSGHMLEKSSTESTAAMSKYRFRHIGPSQFELISVMDDVALREKAIKRLRFADRISDENRKQLVERMVSLIDCLEAAHGREIPSMDAATHPAKAKKAARGKANICDGLTFLSNTCSLDDEWGESLDYDFGNTRLSEFESDWLLWHPEHTDLIESASNVARQGVTSGKRSMNQMETTGTDSFARSTGGTSGVSFSTFEGVFATSTMLTAASSAASPGPSNSAKTPKFWQTMDPEHPGSLQFVLNIAIGTKENKKPALERLENAFRGEDKDTIRARVATLVHIAQSKHNTPARVDSAGVSDPNARSRFRDQLAGFIVRNLTPRRPIWNTMSLDEQLEWLEASDGELGRLQDYMRQLQELRARRS